jgi:hypothetical protein
MQPPLFHKTEEPLDADAWLRTIESKFALLSAPCSEANKALFAASSFVALPAFGVIITMPCSQKDM